METVKHEHLISALQKKAAYNHPVEDIILRETHISWVLLTGDLVYKIKKPVDFGFLDFSTLEKRKHFCDEEVRLNSRLAPHLYLGVAPINGDIASPMINGKGPVIEYAVIMRQFDTSLEFDELLARNELTIDHMNETARVLADFHSNIAVAGEQSSFGLPEVVKQPVMENFEQISQLGDDWLLEHQLKESLGQLSQWSENQYIEIETTLSGRKKYGFIRECHGDLHLRNIVFYEGKVTPFDGIEFNPNLRWIDVMSELAFLLMDIEDHNRFDLSRCLLNDYLGLTGDYEGLSVLCFYQVYRAMVRAKVAGLQLLQSTNSTTKESLIQDIHNYITLACNYTRPTTPKMIISHGLSGSGKTTLSQRLLEQENIIRLRSDVERKRISGLHETARDRSGINQGIYTRKTSEKTYDRLLQLAGSVIGAGYSVIVDAAFLEQDQRQKFYFYAKEADIPFLILHSTVDQNVQYDRLEKRTLLDKDVSDADTKILDQQRDNYIPLSSAELDDTITIDTTNEFTLSEIIAWLDS